MSHAITNTTPVRIAVPRFDSTLLIPTLASIDVSAANKAEPIAYGSHADLSFFAPEFFFSIIRNTPTASSADQFDGKMIGFFEENDRKKNRKDGA